MSSGGLEARSDEPVFGVSRTSFSLELLEVVSMDRYEHRRL